MRSIVFALLAGILAAGTAMAGPQVTLSLGTTENKSGPTAGTKSDSYSLRIANDLNKSGLNADFITIQNRNTTSLGLSNQYELGLAQRLPVNANVIPYVRVAAGTIMPSTRARMDYVLFEPGVILRASAVPVFTKIDYTVGTGTNTDDLDVTMTRVALGYNLSKEVSVSVRKDWLKGDLVQDMTWLQLGYRF
jgi:predicted porin